MMKNTKSFSRKHTIMAGVLWLALWVGLFSVAMTSVGVKDAYALRVTLKRIVFEGRNRAETITIVNNKAVEQTYRLGWKNMRMTEDKTLTAIKEGEDPADFGVRAADHMLRFAPRRITLPPGGVQQVRLMLRRPRDLAPGEYRSHLWISPEADAVAFSAAGDDVKKASAVQLAMLAGVTLPVFVRHGKMEASGSFSDVKAVRHSDGIKVSLILQREGNRSLYGDFEFACVAGGSDVVLRQSRGIAVYEEVARRMLSFDIQNRANEAVKGCSRLAVRYRSEGEDPLFKGDVIAQTIVTVQ